MKSTIKLLPLLLIGLSPMSFSAEDNADFGDTKILFEDVLAGENVQAYQLKDLTGNNQLDITWLDNAGNIKYKIRKEKELTVNPDICQDPGAVNYFDPQKKWGLEIHRKDHAGSYLHLKYIDGNWVAEESHNRLGKRYYPLTNINKEKLSFNIEFVSEKTGLPLTVSFNTRSCKVGMHKNDIELRGDHDGTGYWYAYSISGINYYDAN